MDRVINCQNSRHSFLFVRSRGRGRFSVFHYRYLSVSYPVFHTVSIVPLSIRLEIKTIPIPNTDPDPEIKVRNSGANKYETVNNAGEHGFCQVIRVLC